jgi:hypothetical protein
MKKFTKLAGRRFLQNPDLVLQATNFADGNDCAFKYNDLDALSGLRLMLRGTAEPLFTPIQGKLVKQSVAAWLI